MPDTALSIEQTDRSLCPCEGEYSSGVMHWWVFWFQEFGQVCFVLSENRLGKRLHTWLVYRGVEWVPFSVNLPFKFCFWSDLK